MRTAIGHLLAAIATWRGSKQDAGAGSIRGAEVDALETEASGIRLQLDTSPVIAPAEPSPPTEPEATPEQAQPKQPPPVPTSKPWKQPPTPTSEP